MDESVKVPKAIEFNRLNDIICHHKQQDSSSRDSPCSTSLEYDGLNMNSFKALVKSNGRSGVVPWGEVGKRTWMFHVSYLTPLPKKEMQVLN